MKGLIVAALAAISTPAVAQDVHKCVNWQGAATYQSEPCPQGQRLDRVYTPTHAEVDGRAVRNFVPSAGGSRDALAPAYGQTMSATGRIKSDAACGAAKAVFGHGTATNGHRNIDSLRTGSSVVSEHCNHSRGPGR
ncbi:MULTISPECIES: DUF4124 domain-containing protein [Luteimonas]|uniref:DUF4124 domain-containing protein n=1 Tax=Luteimonas TaxID=83614 RepID=UPI000F50B83F|nr:MULTISPECIES: DUF4124 domain-containing protein [Luteimonas]